MRNRHAAGHARICLIALCALFLAAACQREEELPSVESVLERYGPAVVDAELRENLVELTIEFTTEMRQGGATWARGGPYFFLFADGTRDLFREYRDLAAVRAITIDADGTEVARATIGRGSLNDYEWRQARNLAGRARLEGTTRPRLVEEMIFYGEDRLEYEYNPEYVPVAR